MPAGEEAGIRRLAAGAAAEVAELKGMIGRRQEAHYMLESMEENIRPGDGESPEGPSESTSGGFGSWTTPGCSEVVIRAPSRCPMDYLVTTWTTSRKP